MITDYFPADRRATAVAIFALGIPIGTMIAAIVGGGWLVANFDWRAAFLALGLAGHLCGAAAEADRKEPPRAGACAEAAELRRDAGSARAQGLVLAHGRSPAR